MADINKINLKFWICDVNAGTGMPDTGDKAEIIPVSAEKAELTNLELSAGSTKLEGRLMKKGKDNLWKVSIQNVSYIKKMYSPNAVTVSLHIQTLDTSGKKLTKKQLEGAFLSKKVEVYLNGDQKKSIGNDFYVQTLETVYTKTDVYVKMNIYSPDYQMAIENNCRMFTAKKMSEILEDENCAFFFPYSLKESIKCDCTNMQHMKKRVDKTTTQKQRDKEDEGKKISAELDEIIKGTVGKEHTFPYLVQYNESFYDFLRRTTNRWGEFLYYEGGQLNIGYDNKATPTEVKDYETRTYCTMEAPTTVSYKPQPQAVADNNLLDNPLEKDGYDVVKNEMTNIADPKGGQDKYIISKLSSLWTNGKKLMDWMIDTGVNDIVSWTKAKKRVANNNSKYNDKYFSSTNSTKYPDRYSKDKNSYNPFSEIKPILNEDRYKEILDLELKASQELMKIDFSTTYPNLKLGQIIMLDGEKYLVIGLRGYMPDADSLNYEATCVPIATEVHTEKGKDNEDNEVTYTGFYPPYLETGHIRQSGIQHATVVDTDDPARSNRVRVKFAWQGKEDVECTPWLLFAQNAATKSAGVHGRHYKDEAVLVDFINGNVERPYVVGAVNQKIPAPLKTGSIVMMSPGGQGVRVADGTGAGMTAFVASLTPGLKSVQSFFPGADLMGKIFTGEKYKELTPRFEGSTEICDHYGIYSIKGCTDSRNITIKSPWGDVKINAFTGITISAPNGDVKIAGKNVTIEAGNNLKLTSGTNIQQKFISRYGKDISALMVTQDISKRAAKKVLELGLQTVDLTLIRNMVEVGFKPQEGTLELKSNRYLKLSAGGASAGFPDEIYANPKKKAQETLKESGTLKMAPAILELLKKIGPCVDALVDDYKTQYQDCISKLWALRTAQRRLQYWANRQTEEEEPVVCNYYTDLKDTLWNPDTKEFTENDMAFKEVVQDTDAAQINELCLNRGHAACFFQGDDHVRKYILSKRKAEKKAVLKCANKLRESIHSLLKADITKGDIHAQVTARFGFFTSYVPDDYIGTFKNAFKKDNCKKLYIYKFMFGQGNDAPAERKNLTLESKNTLDQVGHKTAFKNLIAMNMLEEWGISNKKAIKMSVNAQGLIQPTQQAAVPPKPENEEDFLNWKWYMYVGSLDIDQLKVIKKETNFVTGEVKKAWDNFKCLKSAWEYYSYGSAKDGKILIGTGTTYELGEGIKPINVTYNKSKLNPADVLDNVEQQVEAFLSPIRAHLLGQSYKEITAAGYGQIKKLPELNVQAAANMAIIEEENEEEHDED